MDDFPTMFFAFALVLIVAFFVAGDGCDSPSNGQDILEIEPDGYGLGVNRDQYGRTHRYERRPENLPRWDHLEIFQDDVERNAYGAGVHKDLFGRAVEDRREQR